MRAFTLDSFDTQPVLRDDIAEPTVGDGELLVQQGSGLRCCAPADAILYKKQDLFGESTLAD